MEEYYTVFVKNTNMLSILSGADIEQPYRFQPYVRLVIQLSDYKKFVKTMVDLSVDCFKFKLDRYKKTIKTNSEINWQKLFLFDISRAIINELILAVNNEEEATVIVHCFDDEICKTIKLDEVSKELFNLSDEVLASATKSLRGDIISCVDFRSLSKHNSQLFQYALLLRASCLTKEQNWLNIDLER